MAGQPVFRNERSPRRALAWRVGPRLQHSSAWVRYGIGIAITGAVVVLRYVLNPVLGTSAPLLPLVPAVLLTAIVAGRGPAYLNCVLAPMILAVLLVIYGGQIAWPPWIAHILFFVTLSAAMTAIIHELQMAYRTQSLLLAEQWRAAQTLADRERQLQLIYDHSSDGLMLLQIEESARLRVLSVNKPIAEVTGIAREHIELRMLDEVLPATLWPELPRRCREALREKRTVSFEAEAQSAEGRRFAEILLVPILAAADVITHILVCIKDSTAAHRMVAAQKEDAQRKDEFIAMLAHELRNPLAPIRNIAHLLTRHEFEPARVQTLALTLQRQATQLTRIVDDLLDVSRITRGTIELRVDVIALEDIIRDAVQMMEPALHAKRQKVTVEQPERASEVRGDSARLVQVFANLLSNASKYSHEGSEIRIRLENEVDKVVVRVIDQGVGLEAAMLERVFELFVQVGGALERRESGLGVGLTIVKRLIELHGGRIEARSAGLNQGSEFIVTLPLAM